MNYINIKINILYEETSLHLRMVILFLDYKVPLFYLCHMTLIFFILFQVQWLLAMLDCSGFFNPLQMASEEKHPCTYLRAGRHSH